MRTQVGIVGAGPAGLVLSHMLHLRGIESVVIETRSREYCERRVRAGVLEQGTVDTLAAMGVADRLKREGLVHYGVNLRFAGHTHRIDFADLTGGRAITVYGQNEVLKDLTDARLAAGGDIFFEVADVSVHQFASSPQSTAGRSTLPTIYFQRNGKREELACDFIAGCDGSHGVCRPSIPARVLTTYQKEYPFAWLGILAEHPIVTRAYLYLSRTRLCVAQHALASHQPVVFTMRSRRFTVGVD